MSWCSSQGGFAFFLLLSFFASFLRFASFFSPLLPLGTIKRTIPTAASISLLAPLSILTATIITHPPPAPFLLQFVSNSMGRVSFLWSICLFPPLRKAPLTIRTALKIVDVSSSRACRRPPLHSRASVFFFLIFFFSRLKIFRAPGGESSHASLS